MKQLNHKLFYLIVSMKPLQHKACGGTETEKQLKQVF